MPERAALVEVTYPSPQSVGLVVAQHPDPGSPFPTRGAHQLEQPGIRDAQLVREHREGDAWRERSVDGADVAAEAGGLSVVEVPELAGALPPPGPGEERDPVPGDVELRCEFDGRDHVHKGDTVTVGGRASGPDLWMKHRL